MRKTLLIVCICFVGHLVSGQKPDSTTKTWLGVLTLTETYKIEKNWTPSAQGIVGEHFQRLIRLKNEGVVTLGGRTQYNVDNPEMMGLVIFNARDEISAQQFMQDDPAVKNGIMRAKVHPYEIAMIRCQ